MFSNLTSIFEWRDRQWYIKTGDREIVVAPNYLNPWFRGFIVSLLDDVIFFSVLFLISSGRQKKKTTPDLINKEPMVVFSWKIPCISVVRHAYVPNNFGTKYLFLAQLKVIIPDKFNRKDRKSLYRADPTEYFSSY